MEEYANFKKECIREIKMQAEDEDFAACTRRWMQHAEAHRYTYHFEWLGRPVIQYPQDLVALQEIIWKTRPEFIVETGIAHGGSLIFHASMLALLKHCGHISHGRVIGVDIDIRAHNRKALEEHPLSRDISLIQGSSTDPAVVQQVRQLIPEGQPCMVVLDSSHTHDHVLAELHAYTGFVPVGGYCVVLDTAVEFAAADPTDRPWGRGNSPMTAVSEFLKERPDFSQDMSINAALCISEAPGGYLKRIY